LLMSLYVDWRHFGKHNEGEACAVDLLCRSAVSICSVDLHCMAIALLGIALVLRF
jgi:hypothetical protein